MKYSYEFFKALLENNNIYTVKDFRRLFPKEYLWYCRHKTTIGNLPLHYAKAPNNTHTKENCTKIAKGYKHRSDFQKQDKGAYLAAMRNGWLEEICAHMVFKPFISQGGGAGIPARNRVDLSGKVFGSWKVLHRAGIGKKYGWICECQCAYKTIKELSTSNLTQGLSTKCSKCSNQISKPTLQLATHINNLGFKPEVGNKQFGFEIDIYVPEKNFFIEYDGLVWHSTKFRASAALERARYGRFKAAGMSGIRIFEDQYKRNPELIKNMIAHRLGVRPAAVPGDVQYSIVAKPAAFRSFCAKYHLDGYGRSSWAVVATDSSGTTLAFMGFRPYLSGPHKGQLELSRFCTNYNFNCYRLFGRMLKLAKQHIRQHRLAAVIVSASDNCISDGKVYANNGFKLSEQYSGLNWYYYLHSKGLRMHRAAGRKLNPPKISDQEALQYATEALQTSSGFFAYKKWGKWEPMYKIYGWGQKLWILTL